MIKIKSFKYEDKEYFEYARQIRTEVFVNGQDCPVSEEFDGYDEESIHYMVFYNKKPVAASRWRETDEGIKLERFAVIENYRGKGLSKLLIKKMLEDTTQRGKTIYLNSQEYATGLYEKFGFKIIGKSFEEVGIPHYKMIYKI